MNIDIKLTPASDGYFNAGMSTYLTQANAKRLRRQAKKRGVPNAQLMREILDQAIEQLEQQEVKLC